MKDVENFLEEVINNIREDRAIASDLLIDIMQHLKSSDEKHIRGGPVAAKYLETLQRSNEQLVKVASLVQKKTSKDQGITEKDKQQLFDLINGETED